jgi:hypothetical protein
MNDEESFYNNRRVDRFDERYPFHGMVKDMRDSKVDRHVVQPPLPQQMLMAPPVVKQTVDAAATLSSIELRDITISLNKIIYILLFMTMLLFLGILILIINLIFKNNKYEREDRFRMRE